MGKLENVFEKKQKKHKVSHTKEKSEEIAKHGLVGTANSLSVFAKYNRPLRLTVSAKM